MRLLFVTRFSPPSRGGIQMVLSRLSQALADRHEVTVVAQRIDEGRPRPVVDAVRRGRWFDAFELGRVQVTPLSLTPVERAAIAPCLIEASPRLRRGRSMHGRAYALAGAAFARVVGPAIARAAVDVDVDVVHALGGHELAAASVRAGRLLGAPVVVAPFAHPGQWDDDSASAAAYRQADRIVATLAADARTYLDLGVPPERIEVIPHTCEAPPEGLEPDAVRRRHGIRGDLVLFLGERRPYKGVDLLLQAAPDVARKHPDVTFGFVGPGSALTEFGPRPDGVWTIDVGAVSDRERWSWLAAADVLCLPSANEAFGLVVLEAAATGTPVVVSDIPALRELAQRLGNGIAVPRQPDAIAQGIGELLRDRERLAELSRAGRRAWLEHGRQEVGTARYEQLYESLLAERGSR